MNWEYVIDKFIWIIIGIALKWLVPGSLWDLNFIKNLRARKQQKILNELQSKQQDNLKIGRLEIRQIYMTSLDTPLTSGDILCRFIDQQYKLPPDLQELEYSHLPKKLSQLKSQGTTIDFNEGYGLRSLLISRPQVQEKRQNQPEFVFEPTNFKYYTMINDNLDDLLLPETSERKVSIRQRYNLDLHDFQWADMEKIPFHQWFSIVVGVVTKDNQMVVAIRSKMQAIRELQGGETWHRASMSCAEGMIRPNDSVSNIGMEVPSPFATAFRALNDELGLKRGEEFIDEQVKLIGMGYDKKRCQPIAVFYLELKSSSYLDVLDCWKQTSKDQHENMTLMPVAFEPRSIANLLLGKLTYEGKKVRLFSNHQELGMLLVASYRLGAKTLANALKNDFSIKEYHNS